MLFTVLLALFVILLVYFIKRELSLYNDATSKVRVQRRIVSKDPFPATARAKMDAITEGVDVFLFQADDVLEKKKETSTLLFEVLKKRGFVCIKTKPQFLEASEKLRQVALDYLAQDMSQKIKNEGPDKINVGYINVPNIREYIKLRPTDAEALWPKTAEFKPSFNNFFAVYSKLAFTVFDIVAHVTDTAESQKKQFLEENVYQAVLEFIGKQSSVSMIKYFPLKEPTEVCSEHTDTGLLTFITRTHKPSLEIWDRSIHKYIKVEELVDVGDIIVFVGEKLPQFSQSPFWCATPHRVRMAPGVGDRMSIAFLLDVAK